MKKITCWSYLSKDGEKVHNHIEDGWCKNNTPTIKHPCQIDSWSHKNWIKDYACLVGIKVVKLDILNGIIDKCL